MERLTNHEQAVASRVEEAIRLAMSGSERSRWAAEHRIGISDIGHCREYLRRTLTQTEADVDDPNPMMAFVGTAVGDLVERHLSDGRSNVLTQHTVRVPLEVRDYRLTLTGHPDIIIGADDDGPGEIQDVKTKDRLAVVQRSGPSLQQKFQVVLYAKGAIEQGLVRPEGLICTLIFLDRSGADGPRPEVFSWLYDESILTEAQEWLGDVLYAIENDEEASRDMPRSWCESWCKFAPSCRGGDVEVTGLIEDGEIVAALELYADAQRRESQAKRDKDSAKSALTGVTGNTEKFSVHWTKVNGGEIPASYRNPYEKITVKERRGL